MLKDIPFLKFAMLLIYNFEQNHHASPKFATCTKIEKKEMPTPQMGENIISEIKKEINSGT
jgi:hypothetical protein